MELLVRTSTSKDVIFGNSTIHARRAVFHMRVRIMITIIITEIAVFNMTGYLMEERRRRPVIIPVTVSVTTSHDTGPGCYRNRKVQM